MVSLACVLMSMVGPQAAGMNEPGAPPVLCQDDEGGRWRLEFDDLTIELDEESGEIYIEGCARVVFEDEDEDDGGWDDDGWDDDDDDDEDDLI